MSLLDKLSLSTKTAPPNSLKKVVEKPLNENCNAEEQVAIREAYKLSEQIDYVFFRQYNDRPSHSVAYIIDNTDERLSESAIAEIHRIFWLNGSVPLLYVSWQNKVDVFSVMISPFKNNKAIYNPFETIAEISKKLSEKHADNKIQQYSAYKLANGTFWEDTKNSEILNSAKSAHKMLTDKVIEADEKLEKYENQTLHRKFLLITLLIKYLEDRDVFPEGWFFLHGDESTTSYLDLLNKAEPENIKKMLKDLENKFNGGIFSLPEGYELTKEVIHNIRTIVDAKQGENGQWYLWELYDFNYIPIEVLSNIYQHFAKKDDGAIFTPTILANLLLDQVMSFDNFKGEETVFDPTCGSGIFLVLAFRRLVLKKMLHNNWEKLSPNVLVELLEKTIFGIELDEDSANIACFSLVLAICDALMPDIIWNDLRFKELIGKNILVGDFGEKIDSIKDIAPNGFDIVVGNPPFVKHSIAKALPNKQLAYYILLHICKNGYIKENGSLCMIQPHGFLYNTNTKKLRESFLKDFNVIKILDFISIHNLFKETRTTAIAIEIKNKKKDDNHVITHWTFRKTVSVKEKIFFELDYYDYHYVSEKNALKYDFVWKVNLLGGGRLFYLAKRLKENYPSIEYYLKEYYNLKFSDGYKEKGKVSEKYDHEFFQNKYSLNAKAFNKGKIDENELKICNFPKGLTRPRDKKIYNSPLIIIGKTDTLTIAPYDNGILLYNNNYSGVSFPSDKQNEMKSFYNTLVKSENHEILRVLVNLLGNRSMSQRGTSITQSDIVNLPYPENGDFDMAQWESELIEDINLYMRDYVNNELLNDKLLKKVDDRDDGDIAQYNSTFIRLMKTTFEDFALADERIFDGLRFQAYSFYKNNGIKFEDEYAIHNLMKTMYSKHGETLYTQRILKLYTKNDVIIVKPDKLKYWIRSIAIRDVDSIIKEILTGNYNNE